jgi:low affinity Fe/Cu permease
MRAGLWVRFFGEGQSRGRGFNHFADAVGRVSGKAATFAVAVLVVIVWASTGPIFHFSDTWQLVINTGTTIMTFLMVFAIQNTQNRDALALQLKLDEIACIEDAPAEELERLHIEEKRRANALAGKPARCRSMLARQLDLHVG